jgi:hypothetical protein
MKSEDGDTEGITIILYSYRLLAVAQAIRWCRGSFKGFMHDDTMGIGKTLYQLSARVYGPVYIYEEKGCSLISARAPVCYQSVDQRRMGRRAFYEARHGTLGFVGITSGGLHTGGALCSDVTVEEETRGV